MVSLSVVSSEVIHALPPRFSALARRTVSNTTERMMLDANAKNEARSWARISGVCKKRK